MSRPLTVEEFAFRHDISHNKAKKMMKQRRFQVTVKLPQRGLPVAGIHKRSASAPKT